MFAIMKEKEDEENGNSDTADYGDVYFRYGDTIPAKRSHRQSVWLCSDVFIYPYLCLNVSWLFGRWRVIDCTKVNESITNTFRNIDYSHQHQILPTITEKSQKWIKVQRCSNFAHRRTSFIPVYSNSKSSSNKILPITANKPSKSIKLIFTARNRAHRSKPFLIFLCFINK